MPDKIRKKIIITPHGELKTPFFMPDATRGYVKSVSTDDLERVGVGAMVVNTLHLYLEPGMNIIRKIPSSLSLASGERPSLSLAGGESPAKGGQVVVRVGKGIHSFMNWHRPLLSDSGGFQVFSLIHKNPKMGEITDKGAVFKSPLDGSLHNLTPEKSINIQFDLGVDMMVCLDDCPPNGYDKSKLEISVARTIKWAKRCKVEYEKQIKKRKIKDLDRPLIFSVIQGGNEKDLRKYCADELIKIGFDGYGFGARPVDEYGNWLEDILIYTANLIPKDSLRFALGIGLPEDILRCAFYGWDMFDCVIPTREARHGKLFFWNNNFQFSIFSLQKKKKFYKTININNSKFSKDFSPINENSKLPELRNHTKAYLRHLFKMKEPLGARLASLNNLEFYMELMEKINLL
ncbi:MAG: tRNA guanosine(34) transglycosylase Tgt [bacterium]